jgi:hypothetical protein
MATSLFWLRTRLYRKSTRTVTLAFVAALAGMLVAQFAAAQYAKKRKPDTGPRAVGLLKIDAKGGAQLIPVVIRIDGKFYDAGAYKADPVPMALQPGIVYEAMQAGVSQGLFTTAGAAQAPQGWFADGKWRTTAQLEAAKTKTKAESDKKAQKASEDPVNGGPPRLRRPGDAAPQTSSPSQPGTKSPQAPAPAAMGAASPAATSGPAASTAASASSSKEKEQEKDSPVKDSSAKDSSDPADSGRPVLRRQEASDTSHEQTKVSAEPRGGPFQWIAAISDAGGPEPRPYAFQMKPDEEAEFLKKMLAMASAEVGGRAAALGKSNSNGEEPESKASDKRALSKAKRTIQPTQAPEFQDVQLHVFDLSNSNEPVLILTASATVPSRADLVFTIALVARNDIYGELHKVSAQVTDTQHLDVLPKYEFIDAIDVDGDGRAELLFRLTSDAGTAYAIYSVVGDALWPLFEGKPGT